MSNALYENSSKNSELEKFKDFIEIVPDRLPDGDTRGKLMIYIKSKDLEDFFLSICPDKEEIVKGNYKNCSVMTKAKDANGNPIRLMRLDKPIEGMTGKFDETFHQTDYCTPNMSMLTAVGLGNGINFIFDGMYTEKTVNDTLLNMFRRSLKIYNEYARPLTLRIRVMIEGENKI